MTNSTRIFFFLPTIVNRFQNSYDIKLLLCGKSKNRVLFCRNRAKLLNLYIRNKKKQWQQFYLYLLVFFIIRIQSITAVQSRKKKMVKKLMNHNNSLLKSTSSNRIEYATIILSYVNYDLRRACLFRLIVTYSILVKTLPDIRTVRLRHCCILYVT